MSTNEQDEELLAMGSVLSALKNLDETARNRVLQYVQTRLGMEPSSSVPSGGFQTEVPQTSESISTNKLNEGLSISKDIRSFKEEKKPRSANEMAAVVAYYLQYEAKENERKQTISRTDIEKYFHQAKFNLPKDAKSTLQNSKNAGYLDAKERGSFALNPVGYNLVVHKLPHKSSQK